MLHKMPGQILFLGPGYHGFMDILDSLMKCDWPNTKLVSSGFSILTLKRSIRSSVEPFQFSHFPSNIFARL